LADGWKNRTSSLPVDELAPSLEARFCKINLEGSVADRRMEMGGPVSQGEDIVDCETRKRGTTSMEVQRQGSGRHKRHVDIHHPQMDRAMNEQESTIRSKNLLGNEGTKARWLPEAPLRHMTSCLRSNRSA
jgi:hypothetical protein